MKAKSAAVSPALLVTFKAEQLGEPAATVGAPGAAEGLGTIQQGMLEQSNVDVVQEFVNMIVAQRSYESNARVVTSADQMLQDLTNIGH